MKNIARKQNDFQESAAATVARINDMSAAIASAPDAAADLFAAAVTTEPNAAVKGWLVRFQKALPCLSMEVAADV